MDYQRGFAFRREHAPQKGLIVIRRVSGRRFLDRFPPDQQRHNGWLAPEQEKSGEQGQKGEQGQVQGQMLAGPEVFQPPVRSEVDARNGGQIVDRVGEDRGVDAVRPMDQSA